MSHDYFKLQATYQEYRDRPIFRNDNDGLVDEDPQQAGRQAGRRRSLRHFLVLCWQ